LTYIISDLTQLPKVIKAYAGNLADVAAWTSHCHQDAKISYNISTVNKLCGTAETAAH